MVSSVVSTTSPLLPRLMTVAWPGYTASNAACSLVGYAFGGSRTVGTALGRPVSPSVRLSPNASYFVTLSESAFKMTLNVHDAWRDIASVAWQLTGVVPSGKLVPDAGEHTTF